MKGRVEERLDKWYSETSLDYNVKGSWSAKARLDLSKASLPQASYLSDAVQVLEQVLALSRSQTSLYSAALFKRGYGSSSYSSHERLELGDVVQVLVYKRELSSQFISCGEDGLGTPVFFTVGGVINVDHGKTWLVVKNIETQPFLTSQIPDYGQQQWINTTLPWFYEPESRFQFLELTETVRKVCLVHDCGHSQQCIYNEKNISVCHSTAPLDGGHFYILPRFGRYPPRRS